MFSSDYPYHRGEACGIIVAMTKGQGRLITFVMGTRWDLAPNPLPETVFTRICATCKATTYTEKEFSEQEAVICNACAAVTSQQADRDPETIPVWELPPDLLGNLLAQAEEQGIYPENYVIGFFEWKTGRELPYIRLYNREDKQIYIVQKR
jgi:hypothetical protein